MYILTQLLGQKGSLGYKGYIYKEGYVIMGYVRVPLDERAGGWLSLSDPSPSLSAPVSSSLS